MGDEPYTELKTQLEIERLLTVRVLSASVAIFDTANYHLWGYCVRTGLCATTPFESPDVLPSNRHPAFRDQAPASFIALTPHVPQHPAYGRCDAVLNSLLNRLA